jgi:hypothetical protein
MTAAPLPPFRPCPSCGGVAMLLRPAQPVVCFGCGAQR